MAKLNMISLYPLNNEEINKRITKKSAGNYAYGYTNQDDTFIVEYVGRTDSDLNDRIYKCAVCV